MTVRLQPILLLLAMATSCSTAPTMQEMLQGVESVAFVMHGQQPLQFHTGVIDAASFWATYGEAVSRDLGGIAAIDQVSATGKAQQEANAAGDALILELMYRDHNLAQVVSTALLADLASRLHLNFDPSDIIVTGANTLFLLPADNSLRGALPEADLIVLVEIQELNLTEIFDASSVLMSGITLGNNRKLLTAETPVNLRIFRRNSNSKQHEQVWSRRCGANYTSMRSAYKFETLWQHPERMAQLLDEAAATSVEHCQRVLAKTKFGLE